MRSKIPAQLDLSDLDFLGYGDITLIAAKHREKHPGRKTHPNYVSNVIAGRNRNDEILQLAWEEAQRIKGKFPKQMIRQ
jgi:hypothetical protein